MVNAADGIPEGPDDPSPSGTVLFGESAQNKDFSHGKISMFVKHQTSGSLIVRVMICFVVTAALSAFPASAENEWTWMKGSPWIDQPGVYGIRGCRRPKTRQAGEKTLFPGPTQRAICGFSAVRDLQDLEADYTTISGDTTRPPETGPG
jgi:hypothetical protein